MIADEEKIKQFKRNFRAGLIERLVLRSALQEPVLAGQLSGPESQMALELWLDQSATNADQGFGQFFQEPAMTALYSEAVKEAVEDMKRIVAQLAKESKETMERHGKTW